MQEYQRYRFKNNTSKVTVESRYREKANENGYGMQEYQRCHFRKYSSNNASKVTAERMTAKSIQTECKRNLFGH